MNKVILMGRLVRDPEIRYTGGEDSIAIAKYYLAVPRVRKTDPDAKADFINCTVFGKGAEFAEKYLKKGVKILVTGKIKTGSYTNKEGIRIKTTEIIVEDQEFGESKMANEEYQRSGGPSYDGDFSELPADMEEDLPFR